MGTMTGTCNWRDATATPKCTLPAPVDPLAGHPRYENVKYLGRGKHGFVLQALDKELGDEVALKFIERGQQISKYVQREILNQRRLQHPHVARLDKVFLTHDHLVLVMEYAGGGDLYHHVAKRRGLREPEARWVFQQIMLAVDYCHRMGVANRDIKLENVLLDRSCAEPLVKLADFGFSKDENVHSAPTSRVGSEAYAAPEVYANLQHLPYCGKKADVWSCGVLLFAMTTGAYPFDRTSDVGLPPLLRSQKVIKRILQVDYKFPSHKPLSDSWKDLISKMLVADPAKRMSVHEVLHHPWCSEGLPVPPGKLDSFNASMVTKSLAKPPREEELMEIQAVLQQAKQEPNLPASLMRTSSAPTTPPGNPPLVEVGNLHGGMGAHSCPDCPN